MTTPASSPPAARVARGVLGLALLAAAYLPTHRLLDPARAGAAGAATRDVGEALWNLTLWGTVLAAGSAFVLARLLPGHPGARIARAIAALARLPVRTLAAVCAAVAFALSALLAALVFHRLPTLADAMVQLLQARAWAAGALSAPLPDPAAARELQNGLAAGGGWVSVYPPGHTALLALGLRAGAAWLVGPALTAVTAALTALVARRLLPDRPGAALVGASLFVLSPFALLLGAGYLSHAAAAAAGVAALACALRAREEGAGWALPAGLAMGAMVLVRPWTGLTLGATLTAGTWCAAALERRSRGRRAAAWLAARLGLWVLGGVPPALALAAYDRRFFGAPLRLGYEAAFGPAHGLGLHRGPWGDVYGVREAVAYSGFDLMALGGQLLETPVSAVGLVGAWLLLAPRLPKGAGTLLAWAVAPVAANALYWHHGYHLGPRMLYEAAPAWCLLGALATAELARGTGVRARGAAWLALLAVGAGATLQLPARVGASRWTDDAVARATPPQPADAAHALVFVHGSWASRVAARLAAAGMRRDSIETALRRNDLCAVDLLARRRTGGGDGSAAAAVDFEPLPGSPERLRAVELAPGTFARVDPARAPSPACVREARADRLGTIELEPLAWRTPIPELEEGGPLLFRDLGPEENERVRARHPGRTSWVMLPADAGGLLRYEEGMAALWGKDSP